MADNDITIERSLEQIKKGISDIGAASKAIDKDLKAVKAGLQHDPSSTVLLAQKQELMAQKLENSRQRADELRAAIAELNRIKAENGQLTDGQAKLLATYEQQLKNISAEVIGLTGATQKQADTNKAAEDSTKSFSKSMTEFQSNLSAVKQVMSGVDNAFKMFGGDSNSTMGLMIKQGQQAVNMMAGVASMGKLLGNANTDLAKTFNVVAMSAGAAFAAYSLGNSIINAFGANSKKAAIAMIALSGAVIAGAIAWVAFHGAASLGATVPIITAAVAAGTAGILALTKSAKSEAADIGGTGGVSLPSASTPSVPSYAGSGGGGSGGGGGSTTDYQRIENAVIRALMSSGNISSIREAVYGGDKLTSAITVGTARGTMNIQGISQAVERENRRTGKT